MSVAMETTMNPRLPVTAVAVSTFVLCAACASTAERTSSYREAKVYQTGSNIPLRDRHGMMNVKSVDPESLRQELNGASHAPPAGNKGR
jgi:hypothetical protein